MNKKIQRYDYLIIGIISLVVSVAYFIGAMLLPKSELFFVDSDFIPKIYAVSLFVLSVVTIFVGIKKARTFDEKEGYKEAYPIEYKRTLLVYVVFVAYVMVLDFLGFFISTFFFLSVEIYMFAPDDKKRKTDIIMYVVLSLITSVAVYYVFRNGFNILLPQGILKI